MRHAILGIACTVALPELRCPETQIHGAEGMMEAVRTLESVFGEIARTRMADVLIVNPALRVEAVGFREWQGRRVGVLVTPWTISLVLLPGQDAPLMPLALDEKKTWEFPSGAYEFMGLNDPVIGICHICPLISPVSEFAAHDEALGVAQEIISALFLEWEDENTLSAMIEGARLDGEAFSQKKMSRRDFLRMPLRGG